MWVGKARFKFFKVFAKISEMLKVKKKAAKIFNQQMKSIGESEKKVWRWREPKKSSQCENPKIQFGCEEVKLILTARRRRWSCFENFSRSFQSPLMRCCAVNGKTKNHKTRKLFSVIEFFSNIRHCRDWSFQKISFLRDYETKLRQKVIPLTVFNSFYLFVFLVLA